MISVPWREISPETLDALIEEYVTRDGTDYGEAEVPLTRKVDEVRALLQRGEALVVFDELTETVTILDRETFRLRSAAAGR
ncbi:MAG: YheU family protein [Gammaproteobacteria bacterium]